MSPNTRWKAEHSRKLSGKIELINFNDVFHQGRFKSVFLPENPKLQLIIFSKIQKWIMNPRITSSFQTNTLPTLQHVTTNNTISYLPSRTFHGQDCGSLDQLLANRSYTSCILSFLGKNPVWVLLKKCILSQLRNCCPLCLIHCLTYCNRQWAGKVHLSYCIRAYSVKMFKQFQKCKVLYLDSGKGRVN